MPKFTAIRLTCTLMKKLLQNSIHELIDLDNLRLLAIRSLILYMLFIK